MPEEPLAASWVLGHALRTEVKLAEPVRENRKWWVMAAVATGLFLATIDSSIVNVALPTLARDLNAPFAAVQWVVLAYLLTLVTLIMVAGRLGDMYGKKPLYALGFTVFTLGSLLCGVATGVGFLVAARVLQGVGASLIMALGAAITTEAFPAQERGRAMGVIGLMVSIGHISGPTLGGLILGVLPWQAIFFVNVPLGVIGTLLVLRVVPARPPSARQRFDLKGATLLFGTLLTFFLAVTLGPRGISGSLLVPALAIAAVLGGVAFVAAERSVEHPLIDLGLFANAALRVNVLTGTLMFVASAGLVFLIPFYLQDIQGRSPSEAGLLMIVSPAIMGLSAPLSGRLSDRVGTRPLALLGLAIVVGGCLLVGTLERDTSAAGYIARAAWIGLGMGIFQSPNNSAILGAVPRERLGVASGLASLSRTLGQTTGVALVGAAWAAVVHLIDPTHAVNATQAPINSQLKALHWTAAALALLLCGAVAFAAQSWWRERRPRIAGPDPEK